MSTTTGMKGSGFYDAHFQEQRAALDVFFFWIEEAAPDPPQVSHRLVTDPKRYEFHYIPLCALLTRVKFLHAPQRLL